jgi:hypothetical protein
MDHPERHGWGLKNLSSFGVSVPMRLSASPPANPARDKLGCLRHQG